MLTSSMITDRIERHEVLLPIHKNYDKTKTSIYLDEMLDKSAHTMRSVHLHKHDVLTVPLTVLLYCPIISMTCTLSYQCSNRAGEIYASLPLTSKEMALTSKLYLKILPSSYYQRTTICTLCVMVFGFNYLMSPIITEYINHFLTFVFYNFFGSW